MSGEFELFTLDNGVRVVRHLTSGEVMHPAVGPWVEATQLYVEQSGLAERLCADDPSPVRIYDVGLGGAANAAAALSCRAALGDRARRSLELVSFEVDLTPLRLSLEDPAGFPFLQPWAEAARALMLNGTWSSDGVKWTLLQGDVLERLPEAPGRAELVFHDPFSPETNGTLWTPETFTALRSHARPEGAMLLTYSASTRTRTSLLLGGWCVGVGAAIGQKRETTVAASAPGLLKEPLGGRWLERWRRSSARAPWGCELTPALESQVLLHPQFS